MMPDSSPEDGQIRMSLFALTPLFQLRPLTKQPTGRQDALQASSSKEKRPSSHGRREETHGFFRFTTVMTSFLWRLFHCSCRCMSNALTAFRSRYALSCVSPTPRQLFTHSSVSACAWSQQPL